jgi:hypothetical protein
VPEQDALAVSLDGARQQFQQQIDFFRAKLNLPTETWRDIQRAAHDRAFVVAGAAKADLLADLRNAVDQAVQGGSIGEFRKNFDETVAKHGWTGWTGQGSKAGEAWRTRVIYRSNITTSYAAGRRAQLTDPALLSRRPYWRYVHNDSVTHPRPHHKLWGDQRLTLRHDHPFWGTHFPPNGWFCGCRVVAAAAPGQGDASSPPAGWDAIDPKTGTPVGIDRGWDYAPGAHAKAELQDFIDQKLIDLDSGVGAAMYDTLRPTLQAEKVARFSDFVDASLSGPPAGKSMIVGALKQSWVQAAKTKGVTPVSAEMLVRDADIWHTFRDSKQHQLDLGWYKQLPTHLEAPGAVILDTTHGRPAFLLLFDVGATGKKLVVQLDYRVKKVGLLNVVDTGKVVNVSGIEAMLGKGYDLVEGSL